MPLITASPSTIHSCLAPDPQWHTSCRAAYPEILQLLPGSVWGHPGLGLLGGTGLCSISQPLHAPSASSISLSLFMRAARAFKLPGSAGAGAGEETMGEGMPLRGRSGCAEDGRGGMLCTSSCTRFMRSLRPGKQQTQHQPSIHQQAAVAQLNSTFIQAARQTEPDFITCSARIPVTWAHMPQPQKQHCHTHLSSAIFSSPTTGALRWPLKPGDMGLDMLASMPLTRSSAIAGATPPPLLVVTRATASAPSGEPELLPHDRGCGSEAAIWACDCIMIFTCVWMAKYNRHTQVNKGRPQDGMDSCKHDISLNQ